MLYSHNIFHWYKKYLEDDPEKYQVNGFLSFFHVNARKILT